MIYAAKIEENGIITNCTVTAANITEARTLIAHAFRFGAIILELAPVK